MVVYPDLAFLMGLVFHGGNLYLYLLIHPLPRPRWQRIFFLLTSALFSALGLLPGVPLPLVLLLSLPCEILFLRGKTLRGTVRNLVSYYILEGIRFALTLLFCGVFFTLSLVFLSEGGYFAVSFFEGLFGAFVSFCTLALFLRFRARRMGRRGIVVCRVVLEGKSAEFRCYVDSGNFLTDPVSGYPVVILEYSALRRAFGPSFPDPLSYGFAARFAERGRVIPLKGVAGTGEMLSAFLPDAFFVEGTPYRAMVAVTPRLLDGCGRFCGIIGPSFSEGESECK